MNCSASVVPTRPASVLVSALTLTILGCRNDAEPPTAPRSEPALSAALAPLTFQQVSAGGFHSCGVTLDHRVYCWGEGAIGELGDGNETSGSRPVPVTGNLDFIQVKAGEFYSCGVTSDHKAYCWGDNSFGELGDGSHFRRSTPVAVLGGHHFRRVDAGPRHACGVTLNNQAFCWGDNGDGQLGNGTDQGPQTCPGPTGFDGSCSTRPVAVVGGRRFLEVSAGLFFTCGVTTDNRAFCWGLGALGSDKEFSLTPVRVQLARSFQLVQAGSDHACGLTTGNRIFCWGAGEVGELGTGSETSSRTPVRVVGGRDFAGLSAADGRFSCGVTLDDQAFCWGVNDGGELGRGNNTGPEKCAPARIPCSTRPVAVVGGLQLRQVDGGEGHACGVTTDGRAFCWGLNPDGQLGNGTNQGPERCGEFEPCSTRPVAVVAPEP
jgi:alpha-tubulin suppressor-like RCC1 family protein